MEYVTIGKSDLTGYARIRNMCFCCHRVWHIDVSFEDAEKMKGKKPLCGPCAANLKNWQKKREIIERENDALKTEILRLEQCLADKQLRKEGRGATIEGNVGKSSISSEEPSVNLPSKTELGDKRE